MVTYSQQMEASGAAFAGSNETRGGMRPAGKKSLVSKRVPLMILGLFGVALSAAFPYGLGLAVVVWGIALIGALFGVGFATFALLKDMSGKTATFGYSPATAYMTGKKTKKKNEKPSNEK
jgi:hypothetical protein